MFRPFYSHLQGALICGVVRSKIHCSKCIVAISMCGVNNIHSSSSPSYDRFIASSKVRYPHSSIWCCLFQLPVSSRFFKVIQQLLTSSSSSSRCFRPSPLLSLKNLFQKAVPMQDVTNPVAPFLPSPITKGHVRMSQCHYFEASKSFKRFIGKVLAV